MYIIAAQRMKKNESRHSSHEKHVYSGLRAVLLPCCFISSTSITWQRLDHDLGGSVHVQQLSTNRSSIIRHDTKPNRVFVSNVDASYFLDISFIETSPKQSQRHKFRWRDSHKLQPTAYRLQAIRHRLGFSQQRVGII